MSVALLDISDSNLQLWHADQQLQSPGYALLEGGQYRFGNTARAAARLHPRQINTRFWWQLNTQALQPALGPARHTADLVHAHLLDIHQQGGSPDEVLLSVSSSISKDQLALVLGIIQQCPFNAVGLVNRSVALASLSDGAERLYHLEVQLHQALISEVVRSDGRVELTGNTPLPGCGLLQLQERLVEIIAKAFIRQTRFDPRRKAETEQLLYDSLPEALQNLQNSSETNLEVSGYRARIAREDLVQAGQRLFEGASEALGNSATSGKIIVDPLVGLLPGLHQHLPGLEPLDADALPRAVHQHLDTLVQRSETLNFITALPAPADTGVDTSPEPEEPPSFEPPPTEAPPVTAPTHLLHGSVATPLGAEATELEPGLVLYCEAGHWQLRGEQSSKALINDSPYSNGTALGSGDAITSGTGNLSVLIEVKPRK